MPNEALDLLRGIGISINFTAILLGIGFSIVGWGSWRYGRRHQSRRHMVLGVGLMVYPYFVSNTWWLLAIGTLLTSTLFWP